ncbi:hypothetical protein [Streptomyces sp. NPDC050504]|uniref:hypothetical protein n=1 Tax=Streptomyces sp. NPDC050504 TaxID=3365618 RepID=UPI00379D3F28
MPARVPASPVPPPSVPPTPVPPTPSSSEATRLLCVGSYVDDSFRDAVIDELYVHEERVVAPSFGFDAARVLAHALRARRLAVAWAGAVVALWLLTGLFSGGLVYLFLPPFALLAAASRLRTASKGSPEPSRPRRLAASALRWAGRLLLFAVASSLYSLHSDPGSFGGLWGTGGAGKDSGWTRVDVWAVACGVVALGVAGVVQRQQTARVVALELSRERFGDVPADPAEQAVGFRFRRLKDRIRVEQHSPMVLYDVTAPFLGAGTACGAWTLAVPLRPPQGTVGLRQAGQLVNGQVLRYVQTRIEALREANPNATGVRDRLREIRVEEVVFLPVDGLPARSVASYVSEHFQHHRESAAEEGGEARRLFLRIQVGGWDEEVVTTVFVRAHTQGGLLGLEVVPYVLGPVRAEFHAADRWAHRQRHTSPPVLVARSLVRLPVSVAFAPVVLWRSVKNSWRLAIGGYGVSLPEGPAVSVRELGSAPSVGAFREMDTRRYVESVQEAVVDGVVDALRGAGLRTDEFEARAARVTDGGLYVPPGGQWVAAASQAVVQAVAHGAVRVRESGAGDGPGPGSGGGTGGGAP